MLNQTPFGQFLGSIEGINTKTLSIRLKNMEEYGLVARKVTERKSLQVEYNLTKKGKSLEPILPAMAKYYSLHALHKRISTIPLVLSTLL